MVTLIAAWLYFALQESSRWRATIGKRCLGLCVLTLDEDRLSFGEASIRYWTKVLSIFTLGSGFFMALFDAEHRTLHDKLAGSCVLQSRSEAFARESPLQMEP